MRAVEESHRATLHLMGGGASPSVMTTTLHAYRLAFWPETSRSSSYQTASWWKVEGGMQRAIKAGSAQHVRAVLSMQGTPTGSKDPAARNGTPQRCAHPLPCQ